MSTMRDVAKAAGVSVGTVSNYINRSEPVAAATAVRIQAAIDALGYRVDVTARAFRTGQTYTIGLVVPTITNPYFAEVARAVTHDLWQHGFQTFLCDADADPTRERTFLEQLASRRVDGVLLIHCGDAVELGRLAEHLDVPTVFLDRAVPDQHAVETDNRLGGELAARHLIDLGHRRVGVLAGGHLVANIGERIEGFDRTFASMSVETPEPPIVVGPQALELGYRIDELLRHEPRPTAVFATNDIVAIGAWRTLVELGVRVPEDVSLIGFDDIEMSRLTVPALTTVAQDKPAIGREAAALLLSVIRGEARTPELRRVAPRLVVRGSTAPPAAPLEPERSHKGSTKHHGTASSGSTDERTHDHATAAVSAASERGGKRQARRPSVRPIDTC